MTPEEFKRYKEAEKEHLRKLKELKKAVRSLEKEKSIRAAFERVNAEPSDLLDKQKDLVDRLARETAQQEARLDIALESSSEASRQAESEAAGLEDELRRDRAQALVKQLKKEFEEDESRADSSEDERKASPPDPTSSRPDRPDKTIGKM